MKRIYQRCCGIDVHKATLTACVRVHGRVLGRLSRDGGPADAEAGAKSWLFH
jgi:hypothetical protein